MEPGDHIFSFRKSGLYDHHGIYEGNDTVIHFQGPLKGLPQKPCRNCMYEQPKEGGVVRSCLECFRKDEKVCVIRYRQRIPLEKLELDSIWSSIRTGKVIYGYQSKKIYLELFKGDGELLGHLKISEKESLKYEREYRVLMSRLSCSRSANEIITTANRDGLGKYNLIFNNCEDFAVYCKTGKARSIQVEKKFKIIAVIGELTINCVNRYVDRKKKKKKLGEILANRYGSNLQENS